MNSQKIVELAIKRHELDADIFQSAYTSSGAGSGHARTFFYGRKLILEELELALSRVPPGGRVLDVGCGTGHLTDWIRQRGFSVAGIEPAEQMLQYAEKNFPDIEVKKGISSNIPYPDGHFDFIVAFEVLRYLDPLENEKTYQEFHRVLKKDGAFLVTQVNRFATDGYWLFYHLKGLIYALTKKVYHYCNFTTAAAQERLVRRCGFTRCETIGRMAAGIRIAFKLGRSAGEKYAAWVEKMDGRQRYLRGVRRNCAAHLIVIGQK